MSDFIFIPLLNFMDQTGSFVVLIVIVSLLLFLPFLRDAAADERKSKRKSKNDYLSHYEEDSE